MIVLRKKNFGLVSGIGKLWNKGALGKTAVIGGTALTAGGLYGGAKFLGASKDALTGNMGNN